MEGRRRSKEAQQGRWEGKGSRLGGSGVGAGLEALELLLQLEELYLPLEGHQVEIAQVHCKESWKGIGKGSLGD